MPTPLINILPTMPIGNAYNERDILRVSCGWTAGTSKLSKAIQLSENSETNHVFLTFYFRDAAIIVESIGEDGVTWTPIEDINRAALHGKVKIYHEVELKVPHATRHAMYQKALTVHGKGYAYGQLLRYLLYMKVSKHFKPVTSGYGPEGNLIERKRYTCNQAVCYICYGMVPEFAEATYAWTPEILFRKLHNGIGSKEYFKNIKTPKGVCHG